MPSLSLRGLSQQTYEGLRDLSRRNHRSMEEQVRLLIAALAIANQVPVYRTCSSRASSARLITCTPSARG